MEQIYEIVKDKELVVHKRIVAIIEKVLRAYDLDFNHDRFKQIIYDECEFNTNLEYSIKRYYDGFIFLVNNRKTAILASFLKRFYYLTTNKNFEDNAALNLASKYFYLSGHTALEKAIIFHIEFYKSMKDLEEYERTLLSIMILNYILVKNDIPLIHMARKDVIKYIQYRDLYINDDVTELNTFIRGMVEKNKYQDRSFYKKLKKITLYDIEEKILLNKERIQKEFKIDRMIVFGSFFKGDYRTDSDIDILVIFEDNLTYQDKVKNILNLKEYLFKLFNRYIDVHEVFYLLLDSFLMETNKAKIIF